MRKMALFGLVLSTLLSFGCMGDKNAEMVGKIPARFTLLNVSKINTVNGPGYTFRMSVVRDTQTGDEYLVTDNSRGISVTRISATGR